MRAVVLHKTHRVIGVEPEEGLRRPSSWPPAAPGAGTLTGHASQPTPKEMSKRSAVFLKPTEVFSKGRQMTFTADDKSRHHLLRDGHPV